MIDAYAHLDLTDSDPLADYRARLASAGATGALVVELGDGRDRPILEKIAETRPPGLRVAFMYRNQPLESLLRSKGVAAVRAAASALDGDPPWLAEIEASGRWLLPASSQGIGHLARNLLQIARSRPKLKIYVPHIGWPRRGKEDDPDWPGAIEALSKVPGLTIGVSALGTFSSEPFPHEDVHRKISRMLDLFGPERLVAGTDFPYIEKFHYADLFLLAHQWISARHRSWSDENALAVD